MAATPTLLAALTVCVSSPSAAQAPPDFSGEFFNLKRESRGTGAPGTKLVRRVRWKGDQLTLESQSGKTKLVEVLTLAPAQDRLTHALRYEAAALAKPLELRLVYDRAAPR